MTQPRPLIYPPRSLERGRELIQEVEAVTKGRATFGEVTEEGHGYQVAITTQETPPRIVSWFERCGLLMMTLDTMDPTYQRSPYTVTFREHSER